MRKHTVPRSLAPLTCTWIFPHIHIWTQPRPFSTADNVLAHCPLAVPATENGTRGRCLLQEPRQDRGGAAGVRAHVPRRRRLRHPQPQRPVGGAGAALFRPGRRSTARRTGQTTRGPPSRTQTIGWASRAASTTRGTTVRRRRRRRQHPVRRESASGGAGEVDGSKAAAATGRGPIESFAWVVVIGRDGRVGKARTAAYYLPEETAKLLREGMELGHADDLIHGRTNSKQRTGSVGILTDDAVDRAGYYTQAVVLALIPFKNPKLTFN
ncbi:hypothetical protein ACCO45_012589 [Purpureocillium lilacinum]|uniref:Uncharacterized protein n=1 Tax=Purpureocillium lilacinum TaxID=33203 RepID=A0ACC4DAZ9_PURLI